MGKLKLTEKCGIFGVIGAGFEAARLVHPGLWALQHRGQESSGIASSDGKKIYLHKGMGLVSHVFEENDLRKLKGFLAIGHNRYSTSGDSIGLHAQPILEKITAGLSLALAHNGNLPSIKRLEDFLKKKKISTKDLNDSEMITKAIAVYMKEGLSIDEAVKEAYPLFSGVFCLLLMDKSKIVAVRDSFGIRPLCFGKLNGGFVVASETCALDIIGAKFIREVKPGEMIVIDSKGLKSVQIEKGNQKLDVFEYVYFARPDSVILGKSVDQVRQNLGKELAKEVNIKADIVVPVPDSAIPAAIGFSRQSGIPFEMGLIKNRYIHRTFISPEKHTRGKIVQLKLNPVRQALQGKKIIVVDDSIVRGTTSKKIIKMVRDAGAKEVHLLVSSPPVKFPDFYGIDTPNQKDLIAAIESTEQIRKELGVDSLHFLSYQGLIRAIGLPEDRLCTALFNGNYPVDIGERAKEVDFSIA
ncbi:amidophosphoribosyltransferase [Candidatus Daviesbacteria bacterium RIFCSPHIGHO2_02_FULL_39_12]|uniref:Amidophosphoribosyltransferase n=2 Tax=Candidatus Daviesiibacteriota TaxID=1752718 RepID=A0A1F5JDZ3_9BACT|nr:MAG: amidophosphoribosyltransferase [Candidatus Daviesbacteria bacterium RIFCSPHIGHO2_02_FULL_39_12]OGE71912.1 MAG: amidophosphoribosyltransferase [Candidatus Daviesbacteria bacterium RIFCSPLOWO2_02_FULL_38_15]